MSDLPISSAPSPAPAAPNPPAPPSAPAASAPVARPEWLGESFWDGEKAAIKPEFATHYSELANFHKAETERRAALPQKPEDVKLELKLPDTVKVPDGVDLKIDEKDPRIPLLKDFAVKAGLSQDQVNAIVAIDAQAKLFAHQQSMTEIAEQDKRLGDKKDDRRAAIGNFVKGMKERGEIKDSHVNEAVLSASLSADFVELMEVLMSKAAGNVPGTVQPGAQPQPQAPPKSHADRIWPGGFSASPQAKAN